MKKIWLVAVFFTSVLLMTLMVQASEEIAPQELVGFEITDSVTYNTSMSTEELLALPGCAEAEQEPTVPEEFILDGIIVSGGTAIEPLTWINFPYPAPVDVMIMVDNDMKAHLEAAVGTTVTWSVVYEWANNILEGGDDPFWSSFEIDFVTREYRI